MIREVVEIQADAVRPEGYERAARMLANADIFSDVQRFPPSLRVQIVYGEDDAIAPPALNIRIAEASRAPSGLVRSSSGTVRPRCTRDVRIATPREGHEVNSSL
jgi:hypothetical protein